MKAQGPGRDRRSRLFAWTVVGTLHGLMVAGLWHALRPPAAPPTAEAPAVVWLLQDVRPARAAVPEVAQPARESVPREPAARLAPAAPVPVVVPQAITLPSEPTAEPRAALPLEPQASAPVARAGEHLLETAATRRAIRDAARAEAVADGAARVGVAPSRPSAGERLGSEIGQAAVGDCLKGEYPFAGGGLLSLPFFLAAELRGQCRR